MNNLFRNRYGLDRLNIILAVFSVFFIFSRYLWLLSILLIAILIFRATSRNIAKRQMELRRFEIFFTKISDFLDKLFRPAALWVQRTKNKRSLKKIYKYVKCRYCSKKLRVPKNKGKIKVTCPECKNQFITKT